MNTVYLVCDDKGGVLPLAAFAERKDAEAYCENGEKEQALKGTPDAIWYCIVAMKVE